MQTRIRHLAALVFLAFLAVTVAALATGRVAYAVTEGVSMQPTYRAGDLVVIVPVAAYQQRDVVAYRDAKAGHAMVLHRIIGGNARGYVLKGDNNQSTDRTHPRADRLIGKAVLHVPAVGAALRSPIGHGLFLGLVLILAGSLFVGPRPLPRRADRRVRRACGALMVIDALVLVAVVVAFARAPSPTSPASPAATQTGAFTYRGDVAPSDTYPTGSIVTGDPLFINIARTIGVSFHYGVDATMRSAARGTARLDLDVTAPSGWHTRIPLASPTALTAGAVDLTATLDPTRILALFDRVAGATGVGAGSALDVTVTASTDVSIDGADALAFSSQLPFRLTPLALAMSGVKPTASLRGPVVTSTTPLLSPSSTPARQPGPSPKGIRYGLLAALLLCLGSTVAVWPEPPSRQEVYRRRPVRRNPPPSGVAVAERPQHRRCSGPR